jgi:segregation and condensation protein A
LLNLAREQKVDLTKISILDLADQYLAFVARARRLRLELAADYLVMAAWLAYLKSRLLLPDVAPGDGPSAEDMALALANRLRRLEAIRDVAMRMMERPQLNRDILRADRPSRSPRSSSQNGRRRSTICCPPMPRNIAGAPRVRFKQRTVWSLAARAALEPDGPVSGLVLH